MSGPLAADSHMTLTPLRPPSAADSIRAGVLVRQLRVALDRYHDVRAAEADGFHQFLPNVKQPIYHFTNRRIPLPVARWHEHVNWCLPPRGNMERWRETRDGKPVFGPKSPIATADDCAAVGGRFVPRLFGWMVHVMAFAGDDPEVIWGGEPGHTHS